MSLEQSDLHRKLQLQELEEIMNEAHEITEIYKAKTKAWHDKMISRKSFEVGQKVLRFQSRLRLFPGKLRSRWIEPFIVVKVFPHGVEEITSEETSKILKLNGQRMKPYYEGFQPLDVEEQSLEDPVY